MVMSLSPSAAGRPRVGQSLRAEFSRSHSTDGISRRVSCFAFGQPLSISVNPAVPSLS